MGPNMNFESHAQAGQDLFVWEMTEHKPNGYYLDLGANHSTTHSNTYALEKVGWDGILVDIIDCCEDRKGTFIKSDAANPNDRLRFYYSRLPAIVDYASIDTDEATLGTIEAMPWDKTTFRIITVEHDLYRIGPRVRDEIRDKFNSMGYCLVCSDVMVRYPEIEPPKPFEDWWCAPSHINPELVEKFRCNEKFWKEILQRGGV